MNRLKWIAGFETEVLRSDTPPSMASCALLQHPSHCVICNPHNPYKASSFSHVRSTRKSLFSISEVRCINSSVATPPFPLFQPPQIDESPFEHSAAPLKTKRLAREPERFMWAVSIAQSRCLNLQIRVGALVQDANMLIPYADMLNHSSEPNCFFHWCFKDRMLEVMINAGQDIKKGEENL